MCRSALPEIRLCGCICFASVKMHHTSAYTDFGGERAKPKHLQLIGAVARLVHAMALFEQLEELFNGDAGVGGAPQGEDLPHQHPK